MLLANETVAAHLVDARRARAAPRARAARPPEGRGLRGVHHAARLQPGGAAARALKPKHFQKLIDRMRGTPEERPIAALMLRTMQKARYDAVSLGHFGLAAEHYTHFTSPIRRYPDLVVHRMLRESRRGAHRRRRGARSSPRSCPRRRGTRRRWSGGPTTPSASCCSGRRCASWPTRSATNTKGFVTGVAPFGLFVELVEHYVEGLVHISSMADDYYRFVEQQHVLLRREHEEDLPAGRQGGGAGGARRHGAPADRSGARGHSGDGAGERAAAAGAQPGQGRRFRSASQRPGRRERAAKKRADGARRYVSVSRACGAPRRPRAWRP